MALPGLMVPAQFGTRQAHAVLGPIAAHIALDADHVLRRDAVGDRHSVADPRTAASMMESAAKEAGTKMMVAVRASGFDGFFHGVEHRLPEMGRAAFTRRDTRLQRGCHSPSSPWRGRSRFGP